MKKINEWNGNNRAYSKNFGGGFIGGSDLSKYSGQLDPYPFKSSKLTGADTLINQRTGLVSTSHEGDYYDEEEEDYLNEQEERESNNASDDIAALGKGYRLYKTRAANKAFMKDPVVKKSIEDLIKAGYTEKEAIKKLVQSEAGAGIRAVGTAKPSFLSRLGLTKAAGMAIPVLDIGIAISLIVSSMNQINDFNRNFNKSLNLVPGSELTNYLIDANDRQFDELLDYIEKYFSENDEIKDNIRDQFNDILLVFKDLFMAILVAVAPYVPAAAGSVVPILGNALGYLAGKATGIVGALTIHSIPAERLLFEISSEVLNGLSMAFKIFQSEEKFSEAYGKIKRDSLSYCFVSNFIQSMSRMGKIYSALYSNEKSTLGKVASTVSTGIDLMTEQQNKTNKIINDLNYEINEIENYAQRINTLDRDLSNQRRKEISNLNDQLSEFSGVSALGGSPVTPLGTNAKGERQTVNQQRKRQKFNREKSFPYRKK